MSKFYEPLKTIVEKDDWKIVEENEHTLACSCNGLNGWAISGMSVVNIRNDVWLSSGTIG